MRTVRRRTRSTTTRRGGSAALLAVGALVVVFGAAAVAVDFFWLSQADVELQSSADVACLAAARTLADDETLREEFEWQPVVERAIENARAAARMNTVVGERLELRPGPEGDVWFGRNVLDRETGQHRFVFTDYAPTTVVVRAERTEDTGHPVRTLFGPFFGVREANVSNFSEVTVDNHVVGLRPGESLPTPVLPFALLAGRGEEDAAATDEDEADPNTQSLDDWSTAVDQRNGGDEFGWDAERKRVVRQADGLPEMVARLMPRRGTADETNLQLVDFGSNFRFDDLREQCEHGLTPEDLEEFGGQLMLGEPIESRCSANVGGVVVGAFEDLIGRPRLCFLYEDHEPVGRVAEGRLKLARLVAVRLLDVRRRGGVVEVVLQPTVVATRTAVVDEDWEWADDAPRNRHVYNISVTR